MIVAIGTRSVSKITSISVAFSKYPELWIEDGTVEYLILPKEVRQDTCKGTDIDKLSKVSCIPKTVTEMIQGAKNRALNAFEHAKMVKRHM